MLALLALVPNLVWGQSNELPERYRKWLDEEVVYVITEREREAFVGLRSGEEREAFIEAFWRRRDPDPLTEANEFRDEHYRRIDHANGVLGRETPIPGWMTDRGKMYIILGEPRDRETFLGAPGIYPSEIWFYEKDAERGLSSPFYLLFFQQGFAGEYRLYHPRIHGPEKLFPALQLGEDSRREAYELLQNISAELAHASITFRADEGAIPGLVQDSVSTDVLLAEIYRSPQRRVDARYVDAIARGRGLVETEYLFNYVPSTASVDLLPGPKGLEEASFVHWGIEIDPQNLTLVLDEEKRVYQTSLEIHGEVTSADSAVTAHRFSREEFLELSPSQFAEVQARPFVYRSMFPLLPGDFRFRVILKNRARNEYTILETDLSVSERAPGQVFLGAPVLLHGRESDPSAKPSDYRPYQIGPHRLDPNTKKVYAIGQSLLAMIPLSGAHRGDRVSIALVDRESGAKRGNGVTAPVGESGEGPLVQSIPLTGLAGGRFRLEAVLEDPAGATLASSSTDFDLSPRTSIPRPWSLRYASLDPSVPGVVEAALGEQYLRLEDRARAFRLYERALAKNGELVSPRLVLGRSLLDRGDASAAVEILAPLSEREALSAEVLRTLGDAYHQSGDPGSAIAYFERALAFSGPELTLLNALGACHAATGSRERAIAYLEQSLELVPDQKSVRALVESLRSQPR